MNEKIKKIMITNDCDYCDSGHTGKIIIIDYDDGFGFVAGICEETGIRAEFNSCKSDWVQVK